METNSSFKGPLKIAFTTLLIVFFSKLRAIFSWWIFGWQISFSVVAKADRRLTSDRLSKLKTSIINCFVRFHNSVDEHTYDCLALNVRLNIIDKFVDVFVLWCKNTLFPQPITILIVNFNNEKYFLFHFFVWSY